MSDRGEREFERKTERETREVELERKLERVRRERVGESYRDS